MSANWHITHCGIPEIIRVSADDIKLLNTKMRTHLLLGGHGSVELWYDIRVGEVLAALVQLPDDELKQFIEILNRAVEKGGDENASDKG